jgi:hypothetical protein
MVLCVLNGRLDCREREAVAYLIEENGSCGATRCPTARPTRPE